MSSKPWRTVLGAATLVCLVSFSPANAENDPTAAPINQHACLKCHKRNGMMLGIHARQPQLNCTSCHGEQGKHPRKPNNLQLFSAKDSRAPLTTNGACYHCHQPSQLGAKVWFHNPHAKQLYCWQCHQLHTAQDPALTAPSSELCRRCHQHDAPAQQVTEQEVHHG